MTNPSLTDEERELHIEALGRLMMKAHREGDLVQSRQWLELQKEAINGRSPAQVARMETCYFAEQGDKARQAALARSAAA